MNKLIPKNKPQFKKIELYADYLVDVDRVRRNGIGFD